jgi:flagellar hook-basal body complex protein FliE
MSQMQINAVLAQIRSLSSGAGAIHNTVAASAGTIGTAGATPAFGAMLKQSLDAVNAQQQTASNLANAFERGVKGVDLATVMLESQKASVSFRAVTEVRNRLVNVYQDIMNMPI